MRRSRPPAPPGGLRRSRWQTCEFVSLDFEATGLDYERDRIISFGTVPIRRARIEVGESVYQLVDPGDVPPSPQSITVHGLRPIDLSGAPSFESARVALSREIAGRFLVTWHAKVEASFLHKMYGGAPDAWMKRAVDVWKLVIALEGQEAMFLTLTEAAERFGVPVASPHHALDDALVTAQLFLVTASRMAARGKGRVRDLVEAAPATPPVLVRPRAPM